MGGIRINPKFLLYTLFSSCFLEQSNANIFSSKQNCPEGSRDFRAEQCAEFDGTEFQGKKYKWLPYYGGNDKHMGLHFIATCQQYVLKWL